MASSVQFENTYPEDERWIEAGAEAFAVHFAACCYADRKNTDGLIPKVMVPRVALAVPPESVEAAIESLIRTGFWTAEKTSYRIINYVEDKIGLSAEEKLTNRARWAADKKWRRQHNAGNHEECPPEKCRQSGKVSHPDSHGTARKNPKRVQEDSHRTTRLDSLRLDSTRLDPKGEASERESEPRTAGPASAGAPASPRTHGGTASTPSRTMPGGWVATSEMMGGVDPNTLDQHEVENRAGAYFADREGAADDADAADSLTGLVA